MNNIKTFIKGLRIEPVSSSGINAEGELEVTGNVLKIYVGGAVRDLVSTTQIQTLTNKTMSGASNTFSNIPYSALALTGLIVNADISASAAIAYSKLNLTASIVNADVSVSAAIAYSKLNLSTSIVNADVSNSAAIAYSKLNLTGGIVNADVSASAAIVYSKLNLATSIVNSDVSNSAAIAYSKLNLVSSIVNADIAVAAAIAVTKIATGTADQILGTNSGATANEFKTLSIGTTGTDFAISHSANAIAFNLPDAGASARGVVTTGAQTFAGYKTFSTAPIFSTLSTGILHSDVSGNLSSSLLVNADVSASAAIAYSKLNLASSIVNSDISNSAAIAYSKLNLATSIVNADVSASAAIAYSKLNLVSSIVNADIAAAAAIAYSKLSLTSSIVNADISTSAAIAYSKLASLTASRALVSDGSGVVSVSSVTSATLAFLDATSSVQTQLNSKQPTGNYITNLTGDVTATGPGSVAATIASGAVTNAKISASAAIDFSKLAALSSGNILVGSAGNVASSVTMSGDITITNAGVTAIGANKVTLAQLAQVSTAQFLGRTTAGTGDVESLTAAQATALLNNFVGDSGAGGTKGLVPAPAAGDSAASKFLKADGSWAIPSSSGTGDVVGPASSTDNAIVRFDGTTGKLVQNSSVLIDDNGHYSATLSNAASNAALYLDKSFTGSGSANGDFTIHGIIRPTNTSVLAAGVQGQGISAANGFTIAGLSAKFSNSHTGTTGVGVYVQQPSNTGSLDNYYGVVVEGAATGTVVGDNLALYVASGASKFDGLVNVNNVLNVTASISAANAKGLTLTTTSTSSGTVYGVSAVSTQNGSSNNFGGLSSNVTFGATSTILAGYGLIAQVTNTSGSAVTTGYGVRVLAQGTGNYTNWYGAHFTDYTGGAVSADNYALYVASGASYFTGAIVKKYTTDSATTGSAQTLALPASGAVRLTDASLTSVTGIDAPVTASSAYDFVLSNVTGASITITNDAGTAANRILTGTGSDLTLTNNASVRVIYDHVTTKWRIVGGSGSGVGGVSTLAAIGSSANANGATISGSILNLEPASASFGGVVTTGAQSFAGVKTFTSAPTLSSLSTGILHADAGGALTSSLLVNADVSASAAIAYSKLNLATSIVNADIDTAAAIAVTKIATGTANQILGANSGATANEFKTLSVGTTGTDFAIAHSANAIAFNLPDASAANRGVVTTGTQTLAGDKTLSDVVTFSKGSINPIVSKTANYTATTSDQTILCNATSGAFTITLPAASGNTGRKYYIKKTDGTASTITIDANASELIDGQLTVTIFTQYQCVAIICDGTNWFVT